MTFLESIDVPPRRTDRKTCPSCEATASGCRGHKFLSGRYCCEQCTGNHDQTDD